MKKSEIFFSAILVPIDYGMILLAAIAAYFLRYAPFVREIRPVTFDLAFEPFFISVAIIGIVWIGIFTLSGLYVMKGTRKTIDEISKVFFATSAGMLIVIVAFFSFRELFASRFIILVGFVFSILFVIIARLLVRAIQHGLYTYGIGVHRVVVFGEKKETKEIEKIFSEKAKGYALIKHLQNFDSKERKTLSEIAKKRSCDEVIVLDPDFEKEQIIELMEFCDVHHIVFKYIPDVLSTSHSQVQMQMIAGIPVFEILTTPLEGWGRVYKRLFDIMVSLILIILTSPLMLLTAIAIKLDSKGPVFFSHLGKGKKTKRVGQYGQPFWYLKFRSMVPDSHEMRYKELANKNLRKEGPLVKIQDDPRITRVGKFIRRFSIDELPELFLVFIGHMSLVGPRPHLPEEVEKYRQSHRKVLLVKPGITGMAQISGRSDLSFEDEIRLDLYYIEHWSPILDIIILLKTPGAVLRKRGAE